MLPLAEGYLLLPVRPGDIVIHREGDGWRITDVGGPAEPGCPGGNSEVFVRGADALERAAEHMGIQRQKCTGGVEVTCHERGWDHDEDAPDAELLAEWEQREASVTEDICGDGTGGVW